MQSTSAIFLADGFRVLVPVSTAATSASRRSQYCLVDDIIAVTIETAIMIVLVICATVMKYHRDIEEHKPAGCGTDEPMTAVVSNS